MDWQEIKNQMAEINDLIQQLSSKANNKVITEIINRYKKYCNDPSLELRTLNNAILEHQISITPYQIIILEKIMKLNLTTNIEKIYKNMPNTPEEAEKYIQDLKEKYILANNCSDLVINIEKLSKIEYQSTEPFEKSEYAKKFQLEEDMFYEYIKDKNVEQSTDILQTNIVDKLKQYLNKLSPEEKKNLLIQTLALSYDKNAYISLYKTELISKIWNENYYNELLFIDTVLIYNKYVELFRTIERLMLSQTELEDIYNEFKVIYETAYFKQKINKK